MSLNVDDYGVIDVDTHIIEPPDLWTSRVSVEKWGDAVPHVVADPASGVDIWVTGSTVLQPAAIAAQAGHPKFPPDHPKNLAEARPETWQIGPRLERMDAAGVRTQILYPNVVGFGGGRFLSMNDPALTLACTRAYNDFLAEWASAAPGRQVPMMALPFWDLDLSLAEMRRAAALGHKGIVFTSEPHAWGQPRLVEPHWNPLFAQAQEMGLPINFHIGSGGWVDRGAFEGAGKHANFARLAVLLFVANAQAITDVIYGGVCHRFPTLNFVSVESGVSWLPFLIQALDWQWMNFGVHKEHPEYTLLPSEYFARQIYGCFWFERGQPLESAVAYLGADNVLFETDFPHPTCMSPGEATYATEPREYIEKHLMPNFSEEVLKKLLHDNAARVYHLD
ncbi:MAG TPA: amidohydrolase family protein [Candidatus Binatia bacterium]|nr:amidohydrolase family protein [Candidatus Binatia bacterium]